jgi:hypothetical protein
MADDNYSADYLQGRQAAQTGDNVRLLEGLVGEQTAIDAQTLQQADEAVTAEDRTKKRTLPGRLGTQIVGGSRDAVVAGGQAIEDMTQWLRENTALGELPEGPKLQVKIPPVRKPEGAVEEVVRGASQFLTGFVPFFKFTRAVGLGTGAAGATAGVLTDLTVFDPADPRVSNLLNELAPQLRNPITEYLAADPTDSRAEGRFKNALEGLALGGLADGVFRAAKVLKTAKGMSKEELKALATSERGSIQLGASGEPPVPEGMTRLYRGTGSSIKGVGPESMRGRWFFSDREAAEVWAAPSKGKVTYVDVPTSQIEQFRVKNQAESVSSWSLDPDNEFFVPRDVADRAVPIAKTVNQAPVGAETKVAPLVDIKRVTPEEAKAFLTANPDALNLGDRVLKVGWEQIGDQQGLEEVINRTTRVFRDRVETARRGKISEANLRTLAKELGMGPEDFIGRRVGAALNAEQSLALVNLLGSSAKRLRGLAGQVAAGNLDARQAMLDQLSLHAAIQEQAFGVRAEAGRALRVWGMDADGSIKHARQLAETVERMTGQTGTKLDAERMAHMIMAVDSPAKLAQMTREATQPGWLDMASEYWINALLSNPTTHVANFLSNTLTTMWAIPERALAAQLARPGEGVARGEAAAMLSGLVHGTLDALRIAGKAMREGTPIRPGSKVESYTRKAISGANMGVSGDLGRAMDLLGTTVRLPGRFLMASDEFFKEINFRMELHAQAVREVATNHPGLEGKAAARKVAELVADPDFLKRVKPMADEFADYQTFTRELGEGGQAIAAWRDSHPAAKLVIPFLRTPVNIFKYVGERTPFLNRLSSQVRADLAAGGARADLARARVQLGGMVMASTAVLASSGYITGRGPRDPNLRREWLETHQPYSVKIGGTWYSFNRTDPVGALLGMAADFTDMVGDLDEVDASQLAAAMALSVSNNMLSKTYMTGLADLLEALQSPTEDAAKAITRLAGTIVPAGVASAARAVDPTIREVHGLTDAMMARVPGLSSRLEAKLNLWAEPVQYSGGVGPDWASPVYTKTPGLKPVSEEMQKQGVAVGMPARWVFGTRPAQSDPLAVPSAKDGVPLEPAEYTQYVRLAAGHGLAPGLPLLKDALAAVIASPDYQRQTDGPDGGKALLLKSLVYKYRAAAQEKLIADSTELQAQLKLKMKQRADALVRPVQPGASMIPQAPGGLYGLRR